MFTLLLTTILANVPTTCPHMVVNMLQVTIEGNTHPPSTACLAPRGASFRVLGSGVGGEISDRSWQCYGLAAWHNLAGLT